MFIFGPKLTFCPHIRDNKNFQKKLASSLFFIYDPFKFMQKIIKTNERILRNRHYRQTNKLMDKRADRQKNKAEYIGPLGQSRGSKKRQAATSGLFTLTLTKYELTYWYDLCISLHESSMLSYFKKLWFCL